MVMGLTYAGLAWLNGCVRFQPPADLLMDTNSQEYSERLRERWQHSHVLFWEDAHLRPQNGTIFDGIPKSSLSHAGCLAVHAQLATFALDLEGRVPQNCPEQSPSNPHVPPICDPGCVPALIRTKSHHVAGCIELDDFVVQDLRDSSQPLVQFIALSINGVGELVDDWEMFLTPYVTHYYNHLSVSAFYGCPCSRGAKNTEHIVECPKHSGFSIPEPQRAESSLPFHSLSLGSSMEHELACTHYLPQQSYYNYFDQKTIHDDRAPPFLWVMMVAPSKDRGLERKVYRRLGIGKIWLKKWTEADPIFDTIVLE
jgi:hypothetical protein